MLTSFLAKFLPLRSFKLLLCFELFFFFFLVPLSVEMENGHLSGVGLRWFNPSFSFLYAFYFPVLKTMSWFSSATLLMSVPEPRLIFLSVKTTLHLPYCSCRLLWLLHLYSCVMSYLFCTLLVKRTSLQFEWYIILKLLLQSLMVTGNTIS
jgi:hypothetical protein